MSQSLGFETLIFSRPSLRAVFIPFTAGRPESRSTKTLCSLESFYNAELSRASCETKTGSQKALGLK